MTEAKRVHVSFVVAGKGGIVVFKNLACVAGLGWAGARWPVQGYGQWRNEEIEQIGTLRRRHTEQHGPGQ